MNRVLTKSAAFCGQGLLCVDAFGAWDRVPRTDRSLDNRFGTKLDMLYDNLIPSPTLAEAFALRRVGELSPRTRFAFRRDLESLIVWIDERQLGETPKDVDLVERRRLAHLHQRRSADSH